MYRKKEVLNYYILYGYRAKKIRSVMRREGKKPLSLKAIREGFATLKDQSEYQSLYLAGLSRAVGDWLLGINATRLHTIKYGQNRQVLSIGRVQTPTLALIVNRQKEIDNFKPEPYWVLATIYRETTFTATKGRFTSKEEGEQAFQQIEGKPFEVTKVEKKQGREQPPQLYDLTSLQVDCNRKFGFSAEQTLNLIQQLYEMKLTTYPRVDTTYLSDDVYAKCPQTMNGLFQVKFAGTAPYAELVRPLGGKALPKSKRVFDTKKVTDHHAIIPTGQVPSPLTDMQRTVYVLAAEGGNLGFYRYTGEKLAANRVFLVLNGSNVRSISIVGNVETGISDVAGQPTEGTAFDLQGRRISEPQKGLYIVNGKKMVKR